jgi:hypothetical protein
LKTRKKALGLVETLPTLPAIAAVEWPKGKSVRVITVDTRQLGMRVSRERDWFRLSGQATLDEGLVLQLETLLGAAREKTRFVPMGNGVYAALTRSLKQKLSDLAAVLETDKDGSKAPTIAAAWLDEVLEGTETEASKDFRQAIDRLRKRPGDRTEAAEPAAGNAATVSGRWLPVGDSPGELLAWAAAWPTTWASAKRCRRSVCCSSGAAGGRGAGARADLGVRQTGWPRPNASRRPSTFASTARQADSERDELVSQGRTTGRADRLIHACCCWRRNVSPGAAGIPSSPMKRRPSRTRRPSARKRSSNSLPISAWRLTGTPVENRLADLWSIMRFANPGLLGSVHRFNERFAGPIERNRDRDAQHVLKRLVGPFVLRRTKSEVLQDLPPRTELILTVTPEARRSRTLRSPAPRGSDARSTRRSTRRQRRRRASTSSRNSPVCAVPPATRGCAAPNSGLPAPRCRPSPNWPVN